MGASSKRCVGPASVHFRVWRACWPFAISRATGALCFGTQTHRGYPALTDEPGRLRIRLRWAPLAGIRVATARPALAQPENRCREPPLVRTLGRHLVRIERGVADATLLPEVFVFIKTLVLA